MREKWILWAILAAVLLGGGIAIARAVRRGRQWLGYMRGMIEAGEEEAQTRPKSLSSMGRLLLPALRRDFPEYDLALMERRAKQDALLFWQSCAAGRSLFAADAGVKSFLNDLRGEIARRAEMAITSPFVHAAALSGYENTGAQCFVTYQAACQCDVAGQTVQTKVQIRYLAAAEADVEQGVAVYECPNCGAPVPQIGQKVCAYCGTQLHPAAERSWRLFEIREL